MPQLNLSFPGIPVPEAEIWNELDDEHQQAIVDILARLIEKAARAQQPEENGHD